MPQTLAVFYEKRAVLQPASLFVFPKSTRCQTELLPVFCRYLWRQYPLLREFFLRSLLQETFWASFPLCCRSKRILQWFFFSLMRKKKKKVLGGKPRKEFSFWIGPNSSLLHFNWKSTQKTRKKKKMQLFFTDSQVSFRNFCGMIHVIRMIIAIGRQSGFFSDTKVCLNGECLALHLPTTSDWYEGIESWKISLSFSMTVTPLASEYHVTIS